MRGAIAIEPTTCIAWLIPVRMPSLPKVEPPPKRSVASVTIEPLKDSRPSLYSLKLVCRQIVSIGREIRRTGYQKAHMMPAM